MLLCGFAVTNIQQFTNMINAAVARARSVINMFTRQGIYAQIASLTAQATALANQQLTRLIGTALNVVQGQLAAVFALMAPVLRELEKHLQDMVSRAFNSLNGLLGCSTEQKAKHAVLAPLPPWPADFFAIGLKAMLNVQTLPKLILLIASIAAQGVAAVSSGIQTAGAAVLAPVQPQFDQLAPIYPDLELPKVTVTIIVLADSEIDGDGTLNAIPADP